MHPRPARATVVIKNQSFIHLMHVKGKFEEVCETYILDVSLERSWQCRLDR